MARVRKANTKHTAKAKSAGQLGMSSIKERSFAKHLEKAVRTHQRQLEKLKSQTLDQKPDPKKVCHLRFGLRTYMRSLEQTTVECDDIIYRNSRKALGIFGYLDPQLETRSLPQDLAITNILLSALVDNFYDGSRELPAKPYKFTKETLKAEGFDF